MERRGVVSPTDDITKARAALGRAIREAREHQGVDVDELAAASGISRRTIARIEAGDRESDYELLLALADGLGVRASAFFVRTDELGQRDTARPCRFEEHVTLMRQEADGHQSGSLPGL